MIWVIIVAAAGICWAIGDLAQATRSQTDEMRVMRIAVEKAADRHASELRAIVLAVRSTREHSMSDSSFDIPDAEWSETD